MTPADPPNDAIAAPLTDVVDPRVEEVISAFEELTGLKVVILFNEDILEDLAHKNYVLLKRRGHNSPICAMIKASPLHRVCTDHEYKHRIPRGRESRRPFVDRCPFGAVEVVVPFFIHGQPAATLFCGQATDCRTGRQWERFIVPRIRSSGVNPRAAARTYGDFLHIPHTQLLRYGNLLFHAMADVARSMDDAAWARMVQLGRFPLIGRAVHMIAAARGEFPSQTEMARALGVNPQYFSRLFKKVMGQGFADYVLECRMTRAQRLLQNTSLPVIDIAMEVGYNRHSYFAMKFRQVTGMTPLNYRKARRAHRVPTTVPGSGRT